MRAPISCPVRRGLLLASVLSAAACDDAAMAPTPPATGPDAAKVLWGLAANQGHVVLSTVAPYDTFRIVITPHAHDGTPLTGLGTPTYTSSAPSSVQVSADGLVRVLQPVSGAVVQAALKVGNVRRTRDVLVTATDVASPQQMGTFVLAALDSTRWALNGDGSSMFLDPRGSVVGGFPFLFAMGMVNDTAGVPMQEVGINPVSLSEDIAIVGPFGGPMWGLVGNRTGTVRVAAQVHAYGVSLSDTATFTITMPVWQVVKIVRKPVGLAGTLQTVFEPASVTVRPHGGVIWVNTTGEPVDIVFDAPADVAESVEPITCSRAQIADAGGSGDIPAFGSPQLSTTTMNDDNCRSRRFPVAGTHGYRSPLTGATGRVVVDLGVDAP